MRDGEVFLRHIRRNGTSLGINIPVEIVDLLGLKQGDVVRVTIQKLRKEGKV